MTPLMKVGIEADDEAEVERVTPEMKVGMEADEEAEVERVTPEMKVGLPVEVGVAEVERVTPLIKVGRPVEVVQLEVVLVVFIELEELVEVLPPWVVVVVGLLGTSGMAMVTMTPVMSV